GGPCFGDVRCPLLHQADSGNVGGPIRFDPLTRVWRPAFANVRLWTKQTPSEVGSMSAFEPKGDVHREPSNIQALKASDPRVCSGFARSLMSTNATLEGSIMGNSGNDRRIDNMEFTVSDIARSRE